MPKEKVSAQKELYEKIVGALIDSTPEHWYSFNLCLSAGESGLIHSIESNEGHKDLVSPSEKLLLTTRNLQLYQESVSDPFSEAIFRVWLDDTDYWHFEADFEY